MSSNTNYNTILTFTENTTIYLYVQINIYVTVASKSDPDVIVFENTSLQKPGKYIIPAGSENLIIKLHFNLYKC